MKIRVVFLLVLASLSACTMVPDSIKVPDSNQLVSYSQTLAGSDAVEGKMARWGGIIVGVENKPQKTYVEVVNMPLNHYGKPTSLDDTLGRFKVQIDGFVDPLVFEEGRSITFIGKVTTPLAGMIGEQPYMYPSLIVEDFHLWRNRPTYNMSPFFFDYRMGWYSPFHPFFRPHMMWYFPRGRFALGYTNHQRFYERDRNSRRRHDNNASYRDNRPARNNSSKASRNSRNTAKQVARQSRGKR